MIPALPYRASACRTCDRFNFALRRWASVSHNGRTNGAPCRNVGIKLRTRHIHHPRHGFRIIEQGAPDHGLHHSHLAVDRAIIGH